MRKFVWLVVCFATLAVLALAQGERTLLLRHPTVSRTQIAFSFAGDLWIVAREGGDARRLTSGIGEETDPFFLPDGTQAAFSGEYDGNRDVYVVSVAGGTTEAADLSSQRRDRNGLEARRPERHVHFHSRELLPFGRPDVYRAPDGRLCGAPAAANREAGVILARRLAPRLRAISAMATCVETISRRSDHADLGLQT